MAWKSWFRAVQRTVNVNKRAVSQGVLRGLPLKSGSVLPIRSYPRRAPPRHRDRLKAASRTGTPAWDRRGVESGRNRHVTRQRCPRPQTVHLFPLPAHVAKHGGLRRPAHGSACACDGGAAPGTNATVSAVRCMIRSSVSATASDAERRASQRSSGAQGCLSILPNWASYSAWEIGPRPATILTFFSPLRATKNFSVRMPAVSMVTVPPMVPLPSAMARSYDQAEIFQPSPGIVRVPVKLLASSVTRKTLVTPTRCKVSKSRGLVLVSLLPMTVLHCELFSKTGIETDEHQR